VIVTNSAFLLHNSFDLKRTVCVSMGNRIAILHPALLIVVSGDYMLQNTKASSSYS